MSMNHKLEDLVDVPELSAWLDVNLPQLGEAPLQVELVHGGFSNVIISLNRGGETMMLRRPPFRHQGPSGQCSARRACSPHWKAPTFPTRNAMQAATMPQ